MNTVELWHEISRGREMDRLEEVLAENCVFMSPVVHTPQKGRELTRAYLTAAFGVFNDSFRYVKEVVTPQHAVLEFVCDLDDIVINVVDIMTFDDAGQIVEFMVMVRPLKAVNLLHMKMQPLLQPSQGNKTGFAVFAVRGKRLRLTGRALVLLEHYVD